MTNNSGGSAIVQRVRLLSPRPTLNLLTFGVSVFFSLLIVLTFQFLPGQYQLAEGDVSPYTIKSPQKVTYTSQIRTREERALAAAAVTEIHVFDAAVVEAQRQKLNEVVRHIGDIRRTSGSVESKRDALTRIPDLELRPEVVETILTLSESEWLSVAADAQRVIDLVTRGRITQRQVDEVRFALPVYVSTNLNERQAAIVIALVSPLLRPNFVLDPEATERARREAQELVQPVRLTIEKGETIMRDGDVVRDVDIERLEAVGLRNPTIEWRSIGSNGIILFLLVAGLCIFIQNFRSTLRDRPRQLLLLSLLIATTTLAMKLIVPGRDLWQYVLPVAAPVMLVALLLGADIAIIVNLILATCFGMISSNSFEMTVIAMIGGLAGVMIVWRFERLNTFFLAGSVVALATFAAASGFAMTATDVEPQRFALLAAVSGLNGMLAAALTLGTLAAIGHLFGITTTLGLLELAHPTQPLFRRLLTEAPGTYHHSVVIANLSERAAEAVGADPLLCRVAAYYHDVGKIVRPYAFIENQIAGENIHDRLDPATSARLIAAHVEDGIELARKYRLPEGIRDMIAQHHGTRFVGTFYHRAVQDSQRTIDQAGFRYPGPKPQSRESAILMLADSVEAAIRASKDHSPDVLERVVRKIAAERLSEGQLDECDLTLRDLEQIQTVFVTILRGMFHPRITYPESATEPAPATVPVVPSPAGAVERN